jgi:hypothetical protein
VPGAMLFSARQLSAHAPTFFTTEYTERGFKSPQVSTIQSMDQNDKIEHGHGPNHDEGCGDDAEASLISREISREMSVAGLYPAADSDSNTLSV